MGQWGNAKMGNGEMEWWMENESVKFEYATISC